MDTPHLAGGITGPAALRPLIDTTLDALSQGAAARGGPLPAGGPGVVAERLRSAVHPLLPETGVGPQAALRTLVAALAAGSADPADPHCTAHLHCPPLAVAAAADLAAASLNPSLDSWDQAPAASALEALTTRELARLVHLPDRTTSEDEPETARSVGGPAAPLKAVPARSVDGPATPWEADPARSVGGPGSPFENDPARSVDGSAPALRAACRATSAPELTEARLTSSAGHRSTAGTTSSAGSLIPPPRRELPPAERGPDALVTTGGTESNQLALLLAREDGRVRRLPAPVQVVCGANAHHSVHRAAWLLGLPEPLTLPTPDGVLDPEALDAALTPLHHPVLVVATAGTTDTGAIDPLPALAAVADRHGARLHVDAAYGGPLMFSRRHRGLLRGLERAHTVTLDLHKLGWQPVAAGLLTVPDAAALAPLSHRADYLNADDDTEAGLPDLLGRSLRTTRRPDIVKIAVTLKALGRGGLADLVDRTIAAARAFADLIEDHPSFELYARPTISTVLFRPTGADDTAVAALRRRLLHDGRAVLGRATTASGLWLKATFLNPHVQPGDLKSLLTLVEGTPHR
ncbi:aminotransferase class V-fold PLP-dependent enzyme [Streptomyces sp. NPDC003077]|uniref:pyridoxal phosphate-dependent decarboxylase family protein n=1 Tax=Streptomyces sp. NPDC003077 TaxID=3154443 RepID=UPI0033AFCE30